jgi:hypothetical protein
VNQKTNIQTYVCVKILMNMMKMKKHVKDDVGKRMFMQTFEMVFFKKKTPLSKNCSKIRMQACDTKGKTVMI